MRGYAGLTTLPQKQQPKLQMPPQTYANYAVGPSQISFSFRVEPFKNSLCHMLVYVLVFDFSFQVSM